MRNPRIRFSFLFAALVASAGCAPAPPVIEAGRVGDLAVGDTVEAIEAAYSGDRRRPVDLRLEGMPAPALELMPLGTERRDALVAELIEQDGAQRVYRIQVRDPLIETRRAVGVGDTVGDLRANHAPDRLLAGEGNVGLRVDALSATFLLDRERVQPAWRRTSDADAIPDDVVIRRILLTCPRSSCARPEGSRASEPPAPRGAPARAAENSETFTDAAQGLSFSYPADLGTEYIRPVDWPPQLRVDAGPFTCLEAGAETARAGRTEPVTIDEHSYCVTRVTEGAAGSIYTMYAYAMSADEAVIVLTFSLRAVQCGNYGEPRRTQCERERAEFSADTIADAMARTIRPLEPDTE